MNKALQAVFLDADGTLYDSNKLHYQAHKTAAKELYGLDLDWHVFYREVLLGSETPMQLLQKQGAVVDSKKLYKLKDALYRDFAARKLKAMPGVKDFLIWCQAKEVRCFVISASKFESLQASLQFLNFSDFFEGIISREDSGTRQKPHHYPYTLGLELAGVHADTAVAIEDTKEGITSAKTAGLWCAALKHQTNRVKDLAQADIITKNYRELTDYLALHFITPG